MGETKMVVKDEDQEKAKRVGPESSSPPPPEQHLLAQQYWRQQEIIVVVEEEDGSDVEELEAVVEEQEAKREGQQPVAIRQNQEKTGKAAAEVQAPPLPLPAPALPPQHEHAQARQQQSESPPPSPSQQQQQRQQQQLPAKAPPTVATANVEGVARQSGSSDREIGSLWNMVTTKESTGTRTSRKEREIERVTWSASSGAGGRNRVADA